MLEEAEKKLGELEQTKWLMVAQELHTEDPYQFLRAYSPGQSRSTVKPDLRDHLSCKTAFFGQKGQSFNTGFIEVRWSVTVWYYRLAWSKYMMYFIYSEFLTSYGSIR